MTLANGVLTDRRDHADGGIDLNIAFDGDDSYPTGGTTEFTAFVKAIVQAVADAASDTNVRSGQDLTIVGIVAGDCGQYVPSFDHANDKLFARDGGHATWDEVANTTDISNTFNVTVFCK